MNNINPIITATNLFKPVQELPNAAGSNMMGHYQGPVLNTNGQCQVFMSPKDYETVLQLKDIAVSMRDAKRLVSELRLRYDLDKLRLLYKLITDA